MSKKLKNKFMPRVKKLHKHSPAKKKYYKRILQARNRWKGEYDLPVEQSEELLLRDLGKTCSYCNRIVTPKNFSLDHKHPIERGGDKKSLDNLHLTNMKCNRRKGILTDTEYRLLLDFIDNQFHKKPKHYILKKLASNPY